MNPSLKIDEFFLFCNVFRFANLIQITNLKDDDLWSIIKKVKLKKLLGYQHDECADGLYRSQHSSKDYHVKEFELQIPFMKFFTFFFNNMSQEYQNEQALRTRSCVLRIFL